MNLVTLAIISSGQGLRVQCRIDVVGPCSSREEGVIEPEFSLGASVSVNVPISIVCMNDTGDQLYTDILLEN